jgi:hypothetical protein
MSQEYLSHKRLNHLEIELGISKLKKEPTQFAPHGKAFVCGPLISLLFF